MFVFRLYLGYSAGTDLSSVLLRDRATERERETDSEGLWESVACSRRVNTADAINLDRLAEALMGNQSPSSLGLWVTQVVMHSPP